MVSWKKRSPTIFRGCRFVSAENNCCATHVHYTGKTGAASTHRVCINARGMPTKHSVGRRTRHLTPTEKANRTQSSRDTNIYEWLTVGWPPSKTRGTSTGKKCTPRWCAPRARSTTPSSCCAILGLSPQGWTHEGGSIPQQRHDAKNAATITKSKRREVGRGETRKSQSNWVSVFISWSGGFSLLLSPP